MDEVNEIKINIPKGMEVYLENNTIKFRSIKKSTYEDIAKELFYKKDSYYIDSNGNINNTNIKNINCVNCFTNCTSEKQAKKLLAINQLMTVVKYLNGDWQPNWNNHCEGKYFISMDYYDNEMIITDCNTRYTYTTFCFKSKELAQQAIEILGEETIKLVLCTDW